MIECDQGTKTCRIQAQKTLNSFECDLENVGKFSIWLIVINVLMMIPCYCHILLDALCCGLGMNFDVRCKVYPLENIGWKFDEIKAISQPANKNYCISYIYDYDQIAALGFSKAINLARNEALQPCHEFVFNRNKYYTIYEEFSLVCDYKYVGDVIQIAPMFGIFLSCLFVIPFADVLGRKRVLMCGQNLFFICGLIIPIAPSTTTLIFGRVLSGIGYYTMYIPIQTINVELCNHVYRAYYFVAIHFGIGLGYIMLAIIAINVTYWRLLQIVASSFLLLLPLATWYIPESPMWFYSRNHKTTSWPMLKYVKDPVEQSELLLQNMNNSLKKNSFDVNLVRNRNFFLKIGLFIITGVTYFKNYPGKLNINEVYLNRSLFLLLSGVSELLSCCMSMCSLFFFRRRYAIMIFFLISAIVFFPFALVETGTWKSLTLYLMLEATTSASYIVTALYVTENIPASHRCRGLGLLHGTWAVTAIITFFSYNYISRMIVLSAMGSLSLAGIIIAYYLEEKITTQNILGIEKLTK